MYHLDFLAFLLLPYHLCISKLSHTATFIISCAQGTVGRLCLLRTLFRMDDVIRGYFEFSETQVPCLGCHLSLQYEERYLDAHSVLCESTDPDTFGESPNKYSGVNTSTKNSKTLFASLPLNEKGEPETVTFKLESGLLCYMRIYLFVLYFTLCTFMPLQISTARLPHPAPLFSSSEC